MATMHDYETDPALLIDPAMSAEIVRELGEDFVRDLCDGLDQEAEAGFAQLRAAVLSSDATAICQGLHGLRGAGLNLGFVAFAAWSHELELAAAEGAVPPMATVDDLHALFMASLAAVRQRLQARCDQEAA